MKLSPLRHLVRKEYISIRRNIFLPRLIFIFPIMIMCVMPWVMNMEVKNIVVDVVDNDRTTLSQQLVHRIEASNYFIFNGQKSSYSDALAEIESGKADIIVEIPRHYSKDYVDGNSPKVLIAANAVNGTKGSIGAGYLSNVVTQHTAPEVAAVQETISTLYLYNKNLDYKIFMIPALLAIVVMLMCGFLPALNIVSEKEAGTIEAINVTPVSKWTYILSKLIPYWTIGAVEIAICFVLAWLVYGITSEGSIWLVYLLAMLLAFIFSGFGLIISNYNDTMQQAVFVMWFFVVCLMLLSGLFTPVRSMPDWAYLTTYVNPMHYFIDGIRTVFVRGGDLRSISSNIIALSFFAIFMSGWAILSYKKRA